MMSPSLDMTPLPTEIDKDGKRIVRREARVPNSAEDGIPAIDWQEQPIDCPSCEYQTWVAESRCEPGHACINDRYARRIDRFFRYNPEVSNDHLAHPYFEVRALACRRADVFRLPALIDDPDETVRLSIAMRLPQRLLQRMTGDPHREVRIRVATKLDPEYLPGMMRDPDYHVRALVARRLPEALLATMLHDRDEQVRCEVAERISMPALLTLASDRTLEVRRIVARRLPVGLLDRLVKDPEWLVRWEVAQRAAPEVLMKLVDDEDHEVRLSARTRLAEAGVALPAASDSHAQEPSHE
ncbi:4Fe4S-binding leucine-rich repeat protein [Derxia gummosa]|uniref:4Fe4S-binding leucine-rich repeat protein n=1 Tax=Derxia gummosa DSM 723 TaxID=1121388 RepID=A0A9U5GQK9_9BURK|nr:4Fe4S-binding leucine-rich repeat protein [Derxia gummosa]